MDGALQVTSLAQLLLDPHTRTLAGWVIPLSLYIYIYLSLSGRFAELVQREWLDAGHPFSLRHGHVSLVPEKDRSPSFLLFLDSVWQLLQQFPLSFEFTEQFLHQLLTHSYSSEFGRYTHSHSCSQLETLSICVSGTFLYDTPQERERNRNRTHSLWAHLAQPTVVQTLTNPLYDRNNNVLVVSVSHLTVVSSLTHSHPHTLTRSTTVPVAELVCERWPPELALSARTRGQAGSEEGEPRTAPETG